MLRYLCKQYKKHYDPIVRFPVHPYEEIDGDPVDMMQNILQSLRIRGYIIADRMFDYTSELNVVCLSEKALNLFNSDVFCKW